MATEALMRNLALPNGSRITNAFDSVGRLTSSRLLTSGNSLLNSHAYLCNYAGQRTNQARTDASTVTYTYDNIGQLQSAVGSGGQSTENLGYLYDTAWNLNKRTNAGTPTTFAVDGKNQLTSVGGLSCSYDNNGNLTTRVPVSMCYIYYTYDDENQLVSVATDTGGTPAASRWRSDFTYDGRGRLRKRADYTWYTGGSGSWYPSGEVRYVYDGMRAIQERNSGNTPTVAYTRGSDLSGSLEGSGGIGGLLARSVYSGGAWGSHNCYQADGNGNVTVLVDSGQALSAGYRYNPYGAVIGLSGGAMTNQNVYRFSSKEQMPNSGLYCYGYRFYDPNLQRWLNRDPIGERGGMNLYTFVDNRPVGGLDHLGFTGSMGGPSLPDPGDLQGPRPPRGPPRGPGAACCLRHEKFWKLTDFQSLSDCINCWRQPYSTGWGGTLLGGASGLFGRIAAAIGGGTAGGVISIPAAFLGPYEASLAAQAYLDCNFDVCVEWGTMKRNAAGQLDCLP
jgi:RHS repeat-associated protein